MPRFKCLSEQHLTTFEGNWHGSTYLIYLPQLAYKNKGTEKKKLSRKKFRHGPGSGIGIRSFKLTLIHILKKFEDNKNNVEEI